MNPGYYLTSSYLDIMGYGLFEKTGFNPESELARIMLIHREEREEPMTNLLTTTKPIGELKEFKESAFASLQKALVEERYEDCAYWVYYARLCGTTHSELHRFFQKL